MWGAERAHCSCTSRSTLTNKRRLRHTRAPAGLPQARRSPLYITSPDKQDRCPASLRACGQPFPSSLRPQLTGLPNFLRIQRWEPRYVPGGSGHHQSAGSGATGCHGKQTRPSSVTAPIGTAQPPCWRCAPSAPAGRRAIPVLWHFWIGRRVHAVGSVRRHGLAIGVSPRRTGRPRSSIAGF